MGEVRVFPLRGVDRDAPGRFLQFSVEKPHQLGLELERGEVLAQPDGSSGDVVFGPVAEADLKKGESRIAVVAVGEVGVEPQGEVPETRMAPVGIPGGAVAAGVGAEGLVVAGHRLDVSRDAGRAPGAGGVLRLFARIFVAEAQNGLVAA